MAQPTHNSFPLGTPTGPAASPSPAAAPSAAPSIWQRVWTGAARAAAVMSHPVAEFVEALDNKPAQGAIQAYRQKLIQLTGTPLLGEMLHEAAKTLAPMLPEMIKEQVPGVMHTSLEYTWAKHPKLLEECV